MCVSARESAINSGVTGNKGLCKYDGLGRRDAVCGKGIGIYGQRYTACFSGGRIADPAFAYVKATVCGNVNRALRFFVVIASAFVGVDVKEACHRMAERRVLDYSGVALRKHEFLGIEPVCMQDGADENGFVF